MELQQNHIQQVVFCTEVQQHAWCHQMEGYPHIAKATLEILTLFVRSYLCEQGFSKLMDIKTKKRSRLDCEHDSHESGSFLNKAKHFSNRFQKATTKETLS